MTENDDIYWQIQSHHFNFILVTFFSALQVPDLVSACNHHHCYCFRQVDCFKRDGYSLNRVAGISPTDFFLATLISFSYAQIYVLVYISYTYVLVDHQMKGRIRICIVVNILSILMYVCTYVTDIHM